MAHGTQYDVAIVGGGLAGLTLSIQLARKGYSVIIFEKEKYPFHRVCGEYISLESLDFIKRIGINPEEMGASMITQLQVSSVNGKLLKQSLPLGGFGISRYKLDHTLAQIAKKEGVIVEENVKVNDIVFEGSGSLISASQQYYHARVVCASYGKRSNMDIRWKRSFAMAKKSKLNNYVGVKYHIRTNFPVDTIALHNFKNGYCGVVKVEEDRYCLCYLTNASNLQQYKGNIKEMEKNIVAENPHLGKIFKTAEFLFEEPVTISQISFDKKTLVEDHVLMVGDAAGMIAPLCGNGMSMAMHGSKIAAKEIDSFLQKRITRENMELWYSKEWKREFENRLRMGRRIQRLFGSKWLTNLLISLGKSFPFIVRYLIKKTHGTSF